jgi:ATP phosphoribosyltransferase regulatory subunit
MIALEPTVPRQALEAIRAPFLEPDSKGRGAEAMDTPVMLPLAQVLDLAGEAMRARLFVVQADGIDEACLRPDFTIPVASAHLASGKASGRYAYEGKAFQVAPQGSGAAEEFVQVGLESLGEGGPRSADAEALVLAWRAALAGGRKDLKVTLGDIGFFGGFVDGLGLDSSTAARLKRAFLRPGKMAAELVRAQAPEEGSRESDKVASLLAGLPEIQAAAALEELWTLAGIEPVGGRSAGEIVRRLAERAKSRSAPRLSASKAEVITRFLALEGRPAKALAEAEALAREAKADLDGLWSEWSERLSVLKDAGVPEAVLTLATRFGRPFGYYDGFLFEVWSEALGRETPVAAGGRYDSLLTRMGGPGASAKNSSAVGAMVRPARAWSGSK